MIKKKMWPIPTIWEAKVKNWDTLSQRMGSLHHLIPMLPMTSWGNSWWKPKHCSKTVLWALKVLLLLQPYNNSISKKWRQFTNLDKANQWVKTSRNKRYTYSKIPVNSTKTRRRTVWRCCSNRWKSWRLKMAKWPMFSRTRSLIRQLPHPSVKRR